MLCMWDVKGFQVWTTVNTATVITQQHKLHW